MSENYGVMAFCLSSPAILSFRLLNFVYKRVFQSWDDPWTQRFLDVTVGEVRNVEIKVNKLICCLTLYIYVLLIVVWHILLQVNVIVLTSDRILLLDPREDKFLPTMQLEVPDCSAGLRSITLSSTGILAAAADNGLIYCWELLSSSSSNSNGKQHLTITVTQQSEAELPFGISADRIQWARRCGKAPQLLAAICDDGGLLACR